MRTKHDDSTKILLKTLRFGWYNSSNIMQEKETPMTDVPTPPEKRAKRFPWQTTLIVLVVGAASFVAGTRVQQQAAKQSGNFDTSSLTSLYEKLSEKYDGKLDTNKLIDGAKHGMVDSIGDPYTVYFNQDEKKSFSNDLEGKFEGIGAELAKRNDALIITRTLTDSPAQQAGLLAGDTIVAVNDEVTDGWTVEKAVSKIRGEKGTTVKMTISRGGAEPKEFTITRASVADPSVRTEITADNIGIIHLTRFGETETTQLMRQAASDFKDRGVKGIVLDLRGNGGGYLMAAQDIASLWLRNKVVVSEKRSGVTVDTLKTRGEAVLEGIPTVVLVNGGSASASEILAGALSDNGAATLVGEKTFGKGVVQDVVDLDDGSSLKVTVASWYTPNGKNISKEGIEPKVKVQMTEADYNASRDPQLDKAKELLK